MASGLRLDVKGLKEARETLDHYESKKLTSRMRKGVMSGARLMATAIRHEAPKKTGALRKSVQARSARGGGARVGPKARHAHLVIRGTRPHTIRAKGGGMLNLGGYFARSVRHPGSKPNPFVARGADKSVDKAVTKIVDAITAGR